MHVSKGCIIVIIIPSSTLLKLATTSSELATNLLGLLTQPALARAGSLGELQLRTYWHGSGGGVQNLELAF